MFWYPYTGSIPYALTWSPTLFTTAFAVVALVGMIRVAFLALRAARVEAVSVPFAPDVSDDHEPEVKQVAA